MKGYKTHMARDVVVNSKWKVGKKEYFSNFYKTISVCDGEIFNTSHWAFEDGLLTKRWKNVTCENCLKHRKQEAKK